MSSRGCSAIGARRPGLNFLYVHLNRLIKENDLNMIYVIGPGHGGPGLVAHTYLEGSYTERYPAIERSRNGIAAAVPPVLLALRHSQPRLAGNARLDPRRRRARLFAGPRLWRGLRQSRPDRRLHRRRRRGGNRRAGHELAFQQVPQSGARRRGAADPASQRLQDRQSDGAGAHQPPGADRPVARLWLRAAFRRGRRSGAGASKSCRHARYDPGARSATSRARRARAEQPKARSVRAGR